MLGSCFFEVEWEGDGDMERKRFPSEGLKTSERKRRIIGVNGLQALDTLDMVMRKRVELPNEREREVEHIQSAAMNADVPLKWKPSKVLEVVQTQR